MSDNDRNAQAIWHLLNNATADPPRLERHLDNLQVGLASVTAFALEGTEPEVAGVSVTPADGELTSVQVVVVGGDRVVLVDYEAERDIQTKVLGIGAIRSVDILDAPNLLSDASAEKASPLVVRLNFESGESRIIDGGVGRPEPYYHLEAALPKILGRLP